MKLTPFLLLILAVGILAGCANPYSYGPRVERPLSFVGTITAGDPFVQGRTTVIPLTYKGGEWMYNSATVAYGVKAEVKGRQVLFTVISSFPQPSRRSHLGYEIRVSRLSPGTYELVYSDPDGKTHPVGSVEVK